MQTLFKKALLIGLDEDQRRKKKEVILSFRKKKNDRKDDKGILDDVELMKKVRGKLRPIIDNFTTVGKDSQGRKPE